MSDEIKRLFETLLSNLTPENYDSLITQQELQQNGWDFYYVIDADLIGNYCFPQGFDDKHQRRLSRSITEEYLADEQVTLHTLFHLLEPEHHILFLDEYTGEFRGMINAARVAAKRGRQNIIDLEGLTSRVETNVGDKRKKLPELIADFLTQAIAVVLGRINGLDKAKSLVAEKKLIVDSEELHNDLLEDACEIERGTPEIEKLILEKFIEIRQTNPLYIATESKRIDARVIDRILGINAFIQKNGRPTERKTLFLFAIDSPFSQRVMDRLRDTTTDGLSYPLINNKRIDFYRSTQQYFAYLLCRMYNDNDEIDHETTITNLKRLRRASITINHSFEQAKGFVESQGKLIAHDILLQEEYQDIFRNYKKLRNKYENTGVLKSFKKIYTSIKPNIFEKSTDPIDVFLRNVVRKEAELVKELSEGHNRLLVNMEEEALFSSLFIRGTEMIRDEKQPFRISSNPRDVIGGSYQHLPIFFRFPGSPGQTIPYADYAWRVTELVLGHKVAESTQVYQGFQELITLLNEPQRGRDTPPEEKLIKALITLILPMPNAGGIHEADRDKRTQDWLIRIGKEQHMGELESDYFYLRCWISRRNGQFKKSIQAATRGIRRYPDDPRFYHGYFLADYGLYKTLSTQEDKLHKLQSLIEYATQAFEKYFPFITQYYGERDLALIERALSDCFNNNFCFLYAENAKLLFLSGKEDEAKIYIEMAREKMLALKGESGFRQALPEYYDTEAMLEYVASFLESFKMEENITKAKVAIERAIDLSNQIGQKETYIKIRQKISDREAGESKLLL